MDQYSVFIAGTDTGVGKTVVAGLAARYLKDAGVDVLTQKCIQTGCRDRSEDIDAHMEMMGLDKGEVHSSDIAPYVLAYPASPHLAARIDNVEINADHIVGSYERLSRDNAVIVEGSGGLMVPYNESMTMLDILHDMRIPVILVAGNRLGAINHTLLSVSALREKGIILKGVIFNRSSPGGDELILKDNLDIVSKVGQVRVFGELPYEKDKERLYRAFCDICEKGNMLGGEQ